MLWCWLVGWCVGPWTNRVIVIGHLLALSERDYHGEFVDHYRREFGFVLERAVVVDDVRCRAIASHSGTRTRTYKERATHNNTNGKWRGLHTTTATCVHVDVVVAAVAAVVLCRHSGD